MERETRQWNGDLLGSVWLLGLEEPSSEMISRVFTPSLDSLAPPTDHDGLSGGVATGWRPSRDVRDEPADNTSPKYRKRNNYWWQHLYNYIHTHICVYRVLNARLINCEWHCTNLIVFCVHMFTLSVYFDCENSQFAIERTFHSKNQIYGLLLYNLWATISVLTTP